MNTTQDSNAITTMRTWAVLIEDRADSWTVLEANTPLHIAHFANGDGIGSWNGNVVSVPEDSLVVL